MSFSVNKVRPGVHKRLGVIVMDSGALSAYVHIDTGSSRVASLGDAILYTYFYIMWLVGLRGSHSVPPGAVCAWPERFRETIYMYYIIQFNCTYTGRARLYI